MRPLVHLVTALFLVFTATRSHAATEIPAVKRAAKSSSLNLSKLASKQSMLLQRKYTAKEKIVQKSGHSGALPNTLGLRSEDGMMLRKRLDAAPRTSRRQVGVSVLAADEYDMAWRVPFQPFNGKQLHLTYDTGSSVTVSTTMSYLREFHRLTSFLYQIVNNDAYKPSSLAKPSGWRYSITYMDGTNGGGDVYLDYVTIAGLTIWTTIVWADTHFYDGADGILGVGFAGSLAAGSLVESMVQDFTLLSDVICMTMTSHSGQGALQFGALDATIINEIQYTDVLVQHAHSWDTTATINGVGPFDAMIDTGTTYAFFPTKVAEEIFAKLGLKVIKEDQGKGTPTITWGLCADGKLAPELSVMIGTIPTPFKISSANAGAWNSDRGCRLSIIGTSDLDNSQLAILGAAFLKNVHFVMDRGLYKMGFAQRIVGAEG